MNNVAHVKANFYLLFETEKDKKDFFNIFNKDSIIATDINFLTADGILHKVKFSDLLKFQIVEFEENKKESLNNTI